MAWTEAVEMQRIKQVQERQPNGWGLVISLMWGVGDACLGKGAGGVPHVVMGALERRGQT